MPILSTYCEITGITSGNCTNLIIISATTINPICNQSGSVYVEISGGCINYNFVLYDNIFNPISNFITSNVGHRFSGLSEGIWYVSVTDCSGNTVNTLSSLILTNTFYTNVFQLNNYEICVTITGGTQPYNVNINGDPKIWSYISDTNCFSAACPSTYSVNIFDDSGCTATTILNFSCSTPTINLIGENPTCLNSGLITLGILGGDPSYSITGTNTTTGQIILTSTTSNTLIFNNLYEGLWEFIVSDSNGSYVTNSILLTDTFFVDFYTASTSITSSTFCFIVTGGTSSTIEYIIDSVNFYTANTNTINCFNIIDCGQHTFQLSESTNPYCEFSVDFIVPCPPLVIGVIPTNPICNGFGSINLLGSGGTKPYNYYLTDGLGTTYSSHTNNESVTFLGLSRATWYGTIVDASGTMVTSLPIVLVDTFNMSMSIISINATAYTGTVSITISGGSGSYNLGINSIYSGITNGTYFYILSVGVPYDIDVYDTLTECSLHRSILLPSEIFTCNTISYTNPVCDSTHDGTITISVNGGSTPYTYRLYSGSTLIRSYTSTSQIQTFNNLSSGIYSITVVDYNGSTLFCFGDVTLQNTFLVDIYTNSTCTNIGSFCVIVSGGTLPYSVKLDNNVSTTQLLYSSGTYCFSANCGEHIVLVKDGAERYCSYSEVINLSCGLQITAVTTNENCHYTSGGTISIFVSGGDEPFQYSINSGSTFTLKNTFTGLTSGLYDIVVKDLYGCSATTTSIIDNPTSITAITTVYSATSCSGLTTFQLTLNGVGGIEPYTYLWQPFNVNSQIISINDYITLPGVYTFSGTVFDAFGCSGSTNLTVTLSLITPPILNIINSGTLYCDGSEYVTISAITVGTYDQIYWSSGEIGLRTITAMTPGDYYFYVTVSSCTYTSATVVVNYPSIISPIIGSDTILCLCNSTILSLIDNGSIYHDILWSNGSNNDTITVSSCTLESNSYYLTALNEFGCVVTSNTVNVMYVELDVNLFKIDATCPLCYDGYAEVQIISGTGPYTFEWTGITSTTNVANNLNPGKYIVKITDISGCYTIITFEIYGETSQQCIYEPIRNLPIPSETIGNIILNSDGTISFYNSNALPIKIITNVVPEDCCLQYSTSERPLQYCNGKCYWTQPGCSNTNTEKILLGINGNSGVELISNDDINCQYQVSFDYLFNFDCEKVFECIDTNFSGNVLTFLSGLSVSATVDVLSGTTYITKQIIPIWSFNFYNIPTGVYFNGDSNYCEIINQLIYNELGNNCTALTETTFAIIWQHITFKINKSLSGKTIKLGLIMEGFNCDYNILLDKLKIEEICIIETQEILSDNSCPGFELEKIVDNKKSWIYNEELYNRDWEHLKYRDTSYLDYHEKLDINTKEVDLDIDAARAIEYDAYCYAISENCFVNNDCDNPDLIISSTATTTNNCFNNSSINGRKITIPTSGITAGLEYDIYFTINTSGFGTPVNLVIGVETPGLISEISIIDGISINNTITYSNIIIIPTTYSGYTNIYFRVTPWIGASKQYCLNPNTTILKKHCNLENINLNNFISINSGITFNEFRNLIRTQLIDVKDRQSISEYPLLRYMFDKYLDVCGLNNCNTDSSQYNYTTLNNFAKLLGDYWIDLVEQFVPATTIWNGGSRIYRNSIFDQPKFEYRNFSLGYCNGDYCFDGDGEESPRYSATCYVTTSNGINLSPIGFDTWVDKIITPKVTDLNILNSLTTCSRNNLLDNDCTCDTQPVKCFISANINMNLNEGNNSVNISLPTITDLNILPTTSDFVNSIYSGLTQLGYVNTNPYQNFMWSKETNIGCSDNIIPSVTIDIRYSCLTATSITVDGTIYSPILYTFPSNHSYLSGKILLNSDIGIIGVVKDNTSNGQYGYIYYYNQGTLTFFIIKSFTGSEELSHPVSGVIIDSSNYIYGTTQYNDDSVNYVYGGLYRIDLTTDFYYVLHKFSPSDGGAVWSGQEILQHSNGNLYIPLVGTNSSSIYEWNLTTQTGSVIYTFNYNTGGIFLSEDTVTNKIIGTTSQGGLNNDGSIFSVDPTNPLGTFSIFYSFNVNNPLPNNIQNPSGQLTQSTTSTNIFYGLTDGTYSGGQSLYEFNSTTNNINILHTFDSVSVYEGRNPEGNLTLKNNILYGTCTTNGVSNKGNIFIYNLTTNQYQIIHQFLGSTNGASYYQSYPQLLYNPYDDYIYGSTIIGGNFNGGTLFKLLYTASTPTSGIVIFNCNDQPYIDAVPEFEKLLITYSSSTYITGDTATYGCTDYCSGLIKHPNLEILVQDITNEMDNPCVTTPILLDCTIIYSTHIDNDVWFDGSVTVINSNINNGTIITINEDEG